MLTIVLALAITCISPATAEPGAAGDLLSGTIDYQFVGHQEQMDDEGRTLVWEATISGELEGKMKWWFVNPPPAAPADYAEGQLTFYAARWEIWDGDNLLLAGESAGKTDFPAGKDGIWDGHGRVTEAATKYAVLKGRRIYETGTVILGEQPPTSFTGTGLFVIY